MSNPHQNNITSYHILLYTISHQVVLYFLYKNHKKYNLDSITRIFGKFIRCLSLESYPDCLESEGWEQSGDRCYKFFNDKKPWSAAEAHCVAQGGHLVAITTSDEQLYVGNEVNEGGEYTWIGLSSVVSLKVKKHL